MTTNNGHAVRWFCLIPRSREPIATQWPNCATAMWPCTCTDQERVLVWHAVTCACACQCKRPRCRQCMVTLWQDVSLVKRQQTVRSRLCQATALIGMPMCKRPSTRLKATTRLGMHADALRHHVTYRRMTSCVPSVLPVSIMYHASTWGSTDRITACACEYVGNGSCSGVRAKR